MTGDNELVEEAFAHMLDVFGLLDAKLDRAAKCRIGSVSMTYTNAAKDFDIIRISATNK